MPVQDGLPDNIECLAGEDVTVTIIGPDGTDWSGMTFVSQLRQTAGSDKLADWAITTSTSLGITTITMKLAGDSALGAEDGVTRKLVPRAVFDVQMIETATGKPKDTIVGETLILVKQDVTR